MRIKLVHKKLGRPENALSDEEQTWLSKFLDRPDSTYTIPGKNNQRYVGKENGKSVFVPIKYLLWNIRDLLNIANGCSLANEIDTYSFPKVFGKQLTFRQLYAFLKSRKELVFNRDIPQSSCLCKICKNILLLSKGIVSSAKIALANNVQLLIEDFWCNTQSSECTHSTCVNCSDLELNIDDFHNNKESITFHQWIMVDSKIQKSKIELPCDEICQKFNNNIKVLKKHIYVKSQQHACYNKLKDYSENYSNIQQGEIQRAYFGHDSFLIFTVCCYLRKDGDLINENITIISEASDYSRIVAFRCINKVFDFVREKHNLPPEVTLHIWSDGWAGQFRSRYAFALVSQTDSKLEVNWYYSERHHGKGPMDGIGGTIKNKVFRDVMSNKCLIKNAKDFAEYANKTINGITSIYIPINGLLTEPDNIDNASKIPETLSIHKVTRSFNEDNICVIDFFRVANDDDPFFTYRKDDDPEVCGHEDLPLLFDVDQICAFCKAKYVASKEK